MISMEFREDKNILIATFTNPYHQIEDTMKSIEEITKLLEANDKDLHFIADMSEIKVSFADLVQGLAQAYATPGSVFANPRLHSYTVGSDELVNLGTKAVREQDQYGKVDIKLYTSVADAVADIK